MTGEEKVVAQMYWLTFGGGPGAMVYKDLEASYSDRLSFDSDALRMAFNEGQRSVFLAIKALIEMGSAGKDPAELPVENKETI